MADVKWKQRSTRDGDYAEHFRGPYLITVQDMDGNGTEWRVWLKADLDKAHAERQAGNEVSYASPIASGYIGEQTREDFEISKAVAIKALDEIIRDREETERLRASQRRSGEQS